MESICIPRTPEIEKEFIELENGILKEKMLKIIFQTLIEAKFLEDFPPEQWIKIDFNLYNILGCREKEFDEFEGYIHPLQPDIDLLFGPLVDNVRKTPLNAVEIKLFRDKTPPKTGGKEGFYAGLGQTLALLFHGIEYVELWHFFLNPPSENVTYDMYTGSYSAYVNSLIKNLNLPIGYLCFSVHLNEDCIKINYNKRDHIFPQKNPFLNSTDSLKIRRLIKNFLEICD